MIRSLRCGWAAGVATVLCVSCGTSATEPGAGSETGSTSVTAAFPVLAVASPTARSQDTTYAALEAAKDENGLFSATFELNAAEISAYADMTAEIEGVLDGSVSIVDAFEPAAFLEQAKDASCFGPSVSYQNHPDATPGEPNASGTLPPGDLGLWAEVDSDTGDACAVAELDSRIRVLGDQSHVALMALAGSVSAATDNGVALPEPGDAEVDVATEMNLVGVPNVTFNSATIEQPEEDHWEYGVKFTFASPVGDFDSVAKLSHKVESDGSYAGTLSYSVETTADKVHGGGSGCADEYRTLAGSLAYHRDANGILQFQSRTAVFCGLDTSGVVEDSSSPAYGQVDFSKSAVDDPTGWTSDANLFVADFDTATLEGSYVFGWQAGNWDSNSRMFNIGLNGSTSDGEAFYGYGDPLAESNGSVQGFFCNWAGPSANGAPGAGSDTRTLHQYAQRQFVTLDSTTGLYSATSSDISYAPTDSCEYDGSGDFVYDTDLDGDLTDETPHAVSSGLKDTTYGGTVYDTISEVIEQRRTPPDVSSIGNWPNGE